MNYLKKLNQQRQVKTKENFYKYKKEENSLTEAYTGD